MEHVNRRMRCKIFIVTYNQPQLLRQNLKTLFESNVDVSVEIINNFSLVFEVPDEYKDRVKVHHQTLRPDWSCGCLSKDWNAAMVNGIVDLKDPWCDQLIMAQDDMLWDPDWFSKLQDIHSKYTFYSADEGDCLISVLPEAIRNIGLYDERFSVIGHHEADFLLRAFLYNNEKSSINDYRHRRVWNPVKETVCSRNRMTGDRRSRVTDYNQTVAMALWEHKWNKQAKATTWEPMDISKIRPMVHQYMSYPYFEKDVYDTKFKRYVHWYDQLTVK